MLPFPLPFPSSFFPSPAVKQPQENQLGDLGSTVSSPSGVRGKAPVANAFWGILNLKIAPGSKIFGYLSQLELVHPKKRQLYWQ